MVERGTQSPVIVIFQGHETEGLQYTFIGFAHGAENFRHAVNGSRLGLERDFDKVTFAERLR